ncbi:MAG: glycosyltransferase family 2 protein [Bacteroides sp.]|nr:glycosyltransferase family 2 protein [Bacteroides sp.]
MDKVAVVILNWNGEEMLGRFLPSVVEHSREEGVTVYVVDNGSTDRSVAFIENEFPEVKLIRLNRNYGFAEGYNQALARVEATYAVLLNSDVEVTREWLTPMISYMDNHPEVAACQPKILDQNYKEYFEYAGACGGFIDRYGYPFCRGRILGSVEKDIHQYDTVIPVFWATGASLFIRLDEYKEVGGLDGSFFAHMEEIDLCWRLKSRGKEIVVIPQSEVYHVGGGTLKKETPRKTFLNFRNNLIMLYKNLPEQELRRVLFIRMIADYLAAFVFFLQGNGQNARAVYKARREFRKKRADYQKLREENLDRMRKPEIAERWKQSILVAYYLRGIKKYSELIQ